MEQTAACVLRPPPCPPPPGGSRPELLSDITTHLLTKSCLHMALRAPTFPQIQTPPPLAVTSFVCFPVSVLPCLRVSSGLCLRLGLATTCPLPRHVTISLSCLASHSSTVISTHRHVIYPAPHRPPAPQWPYLAALQLCPFLSQDSGLGSHPPCL